MFVSIPVQRTILTTHHTPSQYSGRGHVSEKTDAFAMGIVIIELLISGSIETKIAEKFPLKARDMVDGKDAADLSAAIQSMAVGSGWADDYATRAAKILIDVAVSCTGRTEKRQTPTMVLRRIESAYELVMELV
jgi:hypothetical protein